MTQQPQQLKFGDRVRCKQTGAAMRIQAAEAV